MEQRQLRLGDILDDYCPRERRVTNHAVVALVGDEVKQTRCTTCDADHEYKHAKVPRQRRKADSPAALYAQVSANAPKRVAASQPAAAEPRADAPADADEFEMPEAPAAEEEAQPLAVAPDDADVDEESDEGDDGNRDEGPVHRPLIRASLPRAEGQPPPSRPIPEFTIRQPAGRPGRFRPRHARSGGPQTFQGNRSGGNVGGGQNRGGGQRQGGGGGHQPQGSMRRHGPPGGRKRSK